MPAAPPTVTPQMIWNTLLAKGASSVQAAAMMGNFWFESSWDPESNAVDSNGYRAYGLASWNSQDYPSASTLVTGNPQTDLNSQINFLAQTGGLKAATGSTVQQAASNFAANYERCQGCAAGGSQNKERVSRAQAVLAMARSGKWNQSSGGGTGEQGSPADCLIQMPSIDLKITSVGGGCAMSKSEGRAITGTAVLIAGGGIMALGVVLLAAYGLKNSPAPKLLEDIGGAVAVIPGAQGAGYALHAAGRKARQPAPSRPASGKPAAGKKESGGSGQQPARPRKPRAPRTYPNKNPKTGK